MAIYHCHVNVISRGKGRSCVGASAYRSGEKIENERDGIIHDYTKKSGVVYSETMLPQNAPNEWQDRSKLWNEVEKVEKAKDSRLAREYEIALPRELTREQQKECVKNISQIYFVNEGQCVDIAIHDKEDGNPHAHIMTTIRPINENGEWESKSEKLYLCKNADGEERAFTSKELAKTENAEWKKQYHYSKDGNSRGKKVYITEYEKNNNPKYADYERIKNDKQPKTQKYGKQNEKIERWNSTEYLNNVRAGVSDEINMSLEKYGHEERVDHRSYKEQGIEQIPTKHIGKTQIEMKERIEKGKMKPIKWEYDKTEINKKIKSQNEQIKLINKQERELTIKRANIHTDIQLQNVHNGLTHYKTFIPKANAEQLEKIEKAINSLDKKMEKLKEDKRIYKGEKVLVNEEEKIYIPKLQYEYNNYKKTSGEVKALAEKRKELLIYKVNTNIKEVQIKQELSNIKNEYAEIQKRLEESRKVANKPRITNQYAIAYNNAERALKEIEKNKSIYDKAKEEKSKLGLFKSKEKKTFENTMNRAEENINNHMQTLNKLGITDTKQAESKLKELKLNDSKEKQTLKTFTQNVESLENRAKELENRYTEIRASLPKEQQEEVGELNVNHRIEDKTEGKQTMEVWKEEVKKNEGLEKLRTFKEKVKDKVADKTNGQEMDNYRSR